MTAKRSRSFSLVRAFFYAAATLLTFCFVASGCKASKQPRSEASETPLSSTKSGETIVVLRHGEKAVGGLGQLNCMGLNRSLALPKLLIGRFGRADAIFAPNPASRVRENSFSTRSYSYVRPLATIEPTAIQLGLPACRLP